MTLENFKYRTNPLFLRNQFSKHDDVFGIPIIPKPHFKSEELNQLRLIRFDQIKNDHGAHYNRMVHFFLYDYNFEKVWLNPNQYIEFLKPYKGILSPDFSMYTEMPLAMQLYNTFRNRWCGAYFAQQGLRVVPTVSWGNPDSFDFCFAGIEKGSVVAVSTYMFHKHGNHSDQKELFLNGYKELLHRIEPEYIICYSEPFPEMEGNIIYVDYSLSSLQHMNDDIIPEESIKHTYGILTKPTVNDIIVKTGYIFKGGGSAFGGQWKPKSEADTRLVGNPGEIKITYDKKGTMRKTKIGEDGLAKIERHYTNHDMPKFHTNPHDHKITWENNHPNFSREINYHDNIIPELKNNINYIKNMEVNMTGMAFESLSELKFCINCGSEITFSYKNNLYGIGRATEKEFYIGLCGTDTKDTLICSDIEKILDYKIENKKLRDCLNDIKIITRTL